MFLVSYFVTFVCGIFVGYLLDTYMLSNENMYKEKFSKYPIVEMVNGVLYLVIMIVNGFHILSVIYCLMASALLALSVIDMLTYKIPFECNVFIACLGFVRIVSDYENWAEYVIGFFAVSLFLGFLFIISKGRAMGGGDVKLMAAAGLVVGWEQIILALFAGCIFASVIHIMRMKISHAEHRLAMGPYLSMGILFVVLCGK